MADVFGSLAPQQEDPILPQPRNPAMPANWAQDAVRRVFGGLANIVTLPRRAMDQGITTEEAIPWGGETALTLAGAGAPTAARGAVGAAGGKLLQPEGIRAYHGSPHDFDRFDISKIGTGEGAQSYGHGLYFAEAEPVAKQYRDALQSKAPVSVEGIQGGPSYIIANGVREARKVGNNEVERLAALHSWLDETIQTMRGPYAPQNGLQDAIEAKRLLDAGIAKPDLGRAGRMYEVNINAKPEQFLDWDRPLAGQSNRGAALTALDRFGLGPKDEGGADSLTGRAINTLLTNRAKDKNIMAHGSAMRSRQEFSPTPPLALASQALREAGIPGIKYLDQGSRQTAGGDLIDVFKGPDGWQSKIRMNRPNGEQYFTTSTPLGSQEAATKWAQDKIGQQGTSNYVLFDDKLIDILRKYMVGGAAPLPAAAVADSMTKHQPDPVFGSLAANQ